MRGGAGRCGGEPVNGKNTGLIFFFGGGAVVWLANREVCVHWGIK